MGSITVSLLLFVFVTSLRLSSCNTDAQDAAALLSLKSQYWQNTPPNWGQSNDPCGDPWVGVVCNNSRVTVLRLSTMGLKGTLSGDISSLTQLQSLDLSFNKDLGGTLPSSIGNLKQLTTLILSGCSFSGNIPEELGNLSQLSYLAMNSNQFSGTIPASLGSLSNLYWFDLADNQLTGSLPISTSKSPGLDLLLNAKHFHFNKNQLSGNIPESLFSSGMELLHILFDANNFTGEIPASVGLVRQSLEVLRLDRNSFSGAVPSSISNLTNLHELSLANNKLTGPVPNLTGMNNLNYVDLSNNSFSSAAVPDWFSTIQSLTALVIQSGMLYGQMPQILFSFPQLEQVLLDDNEINGTLDMGNNFSPQLQTVSFQNNHISSVRLTSSYNGTLVLAGNPVCTIQLSNTMYCQLQQPKLMPYSTSLGNCVPTSCPSDQSLRPQACQCAYPYEGQLIFRAPYFRDVTNSTLFQQLEMSLLRNLSLPPGSIFLANPFFNSDNYLQLQLKVFPSNGLYFNRSEVVIIGFILSNNILKPPKNFGPYIFLASPYPFPGTSGRSSLSTGVVAGVAVGCAVLIIGLIVLGIYAVMQKKRARRAIQLTQPFASWGANVKDTGSAPQLKGARWFSFEELKRITHNFSSSNELGSGGYGKVYKGTLPSGEMVAIKRAQQGSTQGGLEFKTEIELLSRVHHKNLVSLVGFCFDQGEQMLVYEFIPNGTLRESLSAKGGKQLDWKRRLKIALGSARGLAYLHELANPTIIHRDVKSPNILLDETLNAKVADFGLSKLVSDTQKGHVSTQVKGTLGYLDPEYYMTQQLSDKSDVYSFGVVMLELITSKQPIENGKYIVREVRIAMDGSDDVYFGLKEIMDPVIRNATDLTGFKSFVKLAMRCVEESAVNRPTMNDVVKEIEMILQEDELNRNPNSASSSATDIKGAPDHPYIHPFPGKDVAGDDAFEYSGGYSFVPKLEPK